jgi:hypothetical protein
MPVTQTDVVNSALVKLGTDTISDISENNKAANTMRAIYDLSMDEVLRAHPWNFAIKRAVLAPTSDTPDFGYDYEYDLPSDCLRAWTLYSDTGIDDIDWVVEGRKILTDEESVSLIYIYRNDDPAAWDACFAEAFSWYLAWKASYALTQSSTVSQLMERGYKASLSEARSMDGMEGKIQGLEADIWSKARR